MGKPFSLKGLLLAVGIGLFAPLAVPATVERSPEIGLPANVCAHDGCSAAQREIWRRFLGADGLEPAKLARLYYGSCYVDGDGFDPAREHYGSVLVFPTEDGDLLDVWFTFHAARQPYAGLSWDAVGRKRTTPSLDLRRFERYAYADVPGKKGAPFRYWLRRSDEVDGLVLVSYFGFRHTILCDLPNEQPMVSGS